MNSKLLLLSVVTGSLAIAPVRPSVATQDPLRFQHRTNRYEGVTGSDVTADRVQLISLTGQIEESSGAPVVLRARFFVEGAGAVRLTARDLLGMAHYWMRPADTLWTGGWQEFAPWPTHAVLDRLRLRPTDLGIVAERPGSPKSPPVFLPVMLYHTRPLLRPTRYQAVLRPLEAFRYATIRLLDCSRERDPDLCDSGVLVSSEELGPLRPGTPVEVELDLGGRRPGRYRLEFRARLQQAPDIVVRSFSLLHPPN